MKKMYNKTPVEAAAVVNLNLRSPHKVNVRWLYFPVQGRKHGAYTKAKEHVETQIRWLAVMSTDELFRVKEAIERGEVPSIFASIVQEMYNVKKTGAHVVEISIGDGETVFPLFEYEDKTSFLNPGIPGQERLQDKPGTVLVRRRKQEAKPATNSPIISQAVMDVLKKSIQPKGK